MATRNVQDYGATGDGATDDTAAINDAIADAGTGDTVLLPATADHYLVATDNRAAVDFTGVADDVTITGEGPGSVLKMDDVTDGKNQWVLGAEANSGTLSGVTIRRLTIDGSREVNGSKSTAGFNLYPGGGGHDIRIEDVVCENCAGTGFSNRGAGSLTLRRVTSRNNGQHGFDFTGAESGTATDAKSLKAVDNDGTGLDFHNGDHVVEDVYCDSNRSGTKMGATGGSADSVVLRNANLRNARENSGFRETMPNGAGTDVTLDNVQVIGAALHGFRLSNSANYTVTEILTDGTGYGPQNRAAIYVTDSASVDADVVRSQNARYGPGVRDDSSGSSAISDYYHYNNPGGTVDGDVSIGSQYNEESGELDVPGSNDVGAFTTTTDTVEETDSTTTESATYRTNFAGYELGTVPSNWTTEHASSDADWAATAEQSPAGSAVLRFDADGSARHALSYDQAGSVADVEALGLFRVSDLSQSPTACGRLFVRGSGGSGNESGYFVNVRDGAFGIWKYDGGSSARLMEWGQPADGQWYFARFRAAGEQLQARVWPADGDEPSEWDAAVSDSALASGWVGVGSYSEFADDWGYLSVGVGGESAPMPDLSANEPALSAVIQTIDGTIQTG